jgi:hypothetical protein
MEITGLMLLFVDFLGDLTSESFIVVVVNFLLQFLVVGTKTVSNLSGYNRPTNVVVSDESQIQR